MSKLITTKNEVPEHVKNLRALHHLTVRKPEKLEQEIALPEVPQEQLKTSRYIKDVSLLERLSPITKEYRTKNFLSRYELACLAGVSESTIKKLERGRPVADYCLLKVAKIVENSSEKEVMGVNEETIKTFDSMHNITEIFKADFEKTFGISKSKISVTIQL